MKRYAIIFSIWALAALGVACKTYDIVRRAGENSKKISVDYKPGKITISAQRTKNVIDMAIDASQELDLPRNYASLAQATIEIYQKRYPGKEVVLNDAQADLHLEINLRVFYAPDRKQASATQTRSTEAVSLGQLQKEIPPESILERLNGDLRMRLEGILAEPAK